MANQTFTFLLRTMAVASIIIGGLVSCRQAVMRPPYVCHHSTCFEGYAENTSSEIANAEAEVEAIRKAYKSVAPSGVINDLNSFLIADIITPMQSNTTLDPIEADFISLLRGQLIPLEKYSPRTRYYTKEGSKICRSQFIYRFRTPDNTWLSEFCLGYYEAASRCLEEVTELIKRDDFVSALSRLGKSFSISTSVLRVLGGVAQNFGDFENIQSKSEQIITDLLSNMELVPPNRRIFYTGDTILDEVITLTLILKTQNTQVPVRQAILNVDIPSEASEKVDLSSSGTVFITDDAGRTQFHIRSVKRSESCIVMTAQFAPKSFPPVFKKFLPTATMELIDSDHGLGEFDSVRMIYIEGGSFTFGGSTEDPNVQDDELPPVVVTIAPFLIDEHEVTNQQFQRFIDHTGHRQSKYSHVEELNKPEQPVVGVSWEDAKAYAEWVGKRLPTEVEFQAAAQGMTIYRYPWGGNFEPNHCASSSNSTTTSPVCLFESGKSPYGIYDLAGNVWEWCSDWYSDELNSMLVEGEPYKSPPFGSFRSIRGGSWKCFETDLRVSNRLGLLPETRVNDVGFRCVKDAQ